MSKSSVCSVLEVSFQIIISLKYIFNLFTFYINQLFYRENFPELAKPDLFTLPANSSMLPVCFAQWGVLSKLDRFLLTGNASCDWTGDLLLDVNVKFLTQRLELDLDTVTVT